MFYSTARVRQNDLSFFLILYLNQCDDDNADYVQEVILNSVGT